jgi:hypothetical protein
MGRESSKHLEPGNGTRTRGRFRKFENEQPVFFFNKWFDAVIFTMMRNASILLWKSWMTSLPRS